MAPRVYDHLIVGSGINALVCAALLARAGHRVCLLERNDRIGGCIRTDELTLPGFRHDVLSQWYPLFVLSPAYAELADDLAAHGLEFAHTNTPTAGLLPDDTACVLTTDRATNVRTMDTQCAGDGARFAAAMDFVAANAELTFAALGQELWRFGFIRILARAMRRQGLSGFARTGAMFARSARHWLEQDAHGAPLRALVAPWVLHAGLSPDAAFSGYMAKVICFSLETAGTPVVRGGSDRLLAAFRGLIEAHGGEIHCDQDVASVVTANGRARGVVTAEGIHYDARRAVICSTTPTQLYRRLLAHEALSPAMQADLDAFRHGLAGMQIHLALNEAPRWRNAAMDTVAMVHVTDGLDGVSRAVNEATRGLLPAAATIVAGQPCVLDPSRAPAGKSLLWIQLPELPGVIRGDALGDIAPPDDGAWTVDVREAYADRILARLQRHIPNLERATLARRVLSPADLEALNCNLVEGDPYGGDCALDQFLLWRPLRGARNHETPIGGLYHIGASTHPGPGLGGGSGYAVACLLR